MSSEQSRLNNSMTGKDSNKSSEAAAAPASPADNENKDKDKKPAKEITVVEGK